MGEADSVFADDCGNLVAKFNVQAFTVPNVVGSGDQLMVLEGCDSCGIVLYSGSTTSRVSDVGTH